MMYRPPNKPSPGSLGIALLLILLALTFIISPTAAAMQSQSGAHNAARHHGVRRPVARAVIRKENGIVTDDDGIIGNGRHGADRAALPHRTHRAHRAMSRSMSRSTSRPTATLTPDGLMPDRNTAPQGMDGHTALRGRDLFPPSEDGHVDENHAADGHVDENHAADGHVDENHAADGGTDDGSADGGTDDGSADSVTDGGTSGTDVTPEMGTEGEQSSSPARSLLPWVIVSVGILAVLLIALALMPKRGRSR